MPVRLIASGQPRQDRWRRKHIDRTAARPRHAGSVARRDEGAIRQATDFAPVAALGAALQPLAVKHLIHLRGARTTAQAVRYPPILGKIFRILSPAFEAGAVPGGERSRLVEKEQFRVKPPPYVALPSFEREHAADPLPRSPAPRRERPRRGVKSPAAIAHESAARRIGKKFAERIDAILQRHCR